MPDLVPYKPPTPPERATENLFLRPKIDAIRIGGNLFVCDTRITGGIGYNFVDPCVPGVSHAYTNAQIWAWYRADRLDFVTRPDAARAVADPAVMQRALASIDDRERANFERRLRYCLAIDEAQIGMKRSAALWQPLCDAVAEKQGDPKMHWKTHYRWWLGWVSTGRDPRALIGTEREKGNKDRKLDDVQLIAMEAAAEEWLRSERPTYATAKDAVNAAIVKAFGGKEEVAKLIKSGERPLVGYGAVRDELVRMGRIKRLYHRHGADATRAEITPTYQQPQVRLPLERVEADFKYMPVFVIDDKTKIPLGTPYLAGGIDSFSGAGAGFDLSFDPPGSASAARLLQNIILPKTFDHCTDRNGNCAVDGDCPIDGVPTNFVLDNDVAFHSDAWVTSARALGCHVTFLEPGAPRKKGAMESYWKAVVQTYTDMIPGKRLRLYKRPPRGLKPETFAVVSLNALRTVLTKAWIDVHNRGIDERSGQIRIERYREAARLDPPTKVPKYGDIVELVGIPETRKVSRKGIRIFGMFYNSKKLAEYRDGFQKDPWVDIRYTLDGISSIVMVDKARGVTIRVPCTLFEYARGLTLHQHRVIRAHAAHMGVNGRVYRQDLELAKADLHRIGKELYLKPESRKLRQRLAHFLGMSPELVEKVRATREDHDAPDSLLDADPRELDDDEIGPIEPDILGQMDGASEHAAEAAAQARRLMGDDDEREAPVRDAEPDAEPAPAADAPRRKRGRPKGSGKRTATAPKGAPPAAAAPEAPTQEKGEEPPAAAPAEAAPRPVPPRAAGTPSGVRVIRTKWDDDSED